MYHQVQIVLRINILTKINLFEKLEHSTIIFSCFSKLITRERCQQNKIRAFAKNRWLHKLVIKCCILKEIKPDYLYQ